jgi:Protein of unknown function (DUF2934)
MPDKEAIAKRAYELYLERGSIPGHETEDWLHAELELAAAASLAMPQDARGRPKSTDLPPTTRRAARRENASTPAPTPTPGRRALRP